MSQQTRMEVVVERWHAFVQRFPSVTSLARASEYEVCEAWAGLGYYSRARNLHRAAKIICDALDGAFPSSAAKWLLLPGVGPYTAGAIASIMCNERTPVVDGNVVRVLSRALHITDPATTPVGHAAFWRQAKTLVRTQAAKEAPGDLNQALMELGALVCVPKAPKCLLCPWQQHCQANKLGVAAALPVKIPKKAPVAMQVAFALDVDRRGLLLTRRPLRGLWAGLWEPPSATGEDAKTALCGQGFTLGRKLGAIDHVLTHRLVRAEVYLATRTGAAPHDDTVRRSKAPLLEPLSGLARKAIALAHQLGVLTTQGAA